MPKALENDLSQLPQFTPPISFRDQLRRELLNTSQPSQSRHPLKLFGFGLVVIVCAILIVIGMQSQKNPFTPQTVSAAEIIQVFLQSHFIPNTVLHRQMYQFEGNKSDYQPNTGRYFDIWQDQNSDRFFQKVIVPGQPTEYQGNNADFVYHVRTQENMIMLYPNQYPPEEREQKHGQETDIPDQLNQLLAEKTLQAYLGIDQNRQAYIIHDTRDSIEKLWDTYYFDAQSKHLLAVEKESDGFFVRVDFVTLESLERNPDVMNIFSFPPQDVDLSTFTIQKQTTNPNTGEYEYVEVKYPNLDTLINIKQDSLEEELAIFPNIQLEDEIVDSILSEQPVTEYQEPITKLSFTYPSDWTQAKSEEDSTIFSWWSYQNTQPLSLSVEDNVDPNTNSPYSSINTYLGESTESIPFTWPNNIEGEYISDNFSTQFIFFNPSKTHILKLKMNIDNSNGVPKGERELIINSARF